jgi:NAD(P) transhydrogenase
VASGLRACALGETPEPDGRDGRAAFFKLPPGSPDQQHTGGSGVRHGVIVIGGGPAGTQAALEAARLGLGVLLADPAAQPGADSGVRNVLTAAVLRAAAHGARPQLHELIARRDAALARELAVNPERLARAGVRVVRGRAVLRGAGEVAIEGHGVHRAEQVVLATGSRARRPARFPFDDRVVCDADSILRLEGGLPRSLVIVGAEVAGCEFACSFAALGANVTLVERRRRLLRCADPEILDLLHREMQALGVVVALEEEVEAVDVATAKGEPHAVVRLGSGRSEVCDRLLVLAGREGAVDPAALSAAGVELDVQGFVVVDEFFQTTRPGVYAIGDVTGPPLRAGVAPHQARSAIFHAAGREPPNAEFPMTVHTQPELAVVGMIEEALKRLDLRYGVGRAEFSPLQRGELGGGARGLVKLTFALENRRLLGVQIVGHGATELIHLGAMVIQAGGTVDQLVDHVYAHPSLSEAYRAAALDAEDADAGAPEPADEAPRRPLRLRLAGSGES